MRVNVLTRRILSQLRHDRRTLALILFAPLFILGLLYLILTGTGATHTIIAGETPSAIVTYLKEQDNVNLIVNSPNGGSWTEEESIHDRNTLVESLKEQHAVAAFTITDDLQDARLYIDGTNASDAAKVKAVIMKALQEESKSKQEELLTNLPFEVEIPEFNIETQYIYGKEEGTIFDTYGASLIGIIIFFFVFLIAGINFLTERTSGTLEKILSTPVKRHEIVLGYVIGFSVLALIQTILVTLFVVYVIGMDVKGSLWYVFLINLLTAICALTMGILISSLANSEFQMVQFIPIVVIPQVFLCGLFSLSKGWNIAGHFLPLYYTSDGLQRVILQGAVLKDIWPDLLALLGFSAVFLLLTVRYLKRLRSW